MVINLQYFPCFKKQSIQTTDAEVAKITKTASDTNLEALKNEHLFQRTDSVESIDENSMSSIDFSGIYIIVSLFSFCFKLCKQRFFVN